MSTDLPPPLAPPLPAAEANVRTWSMLAHLSALVGFIGIPLGNLLGPFVVWQIKQNELPTVVPHAKAALNFQLTVLIACIACVPLMFLFGLGLLLAMGIGLAALICTVIAAIKANNGETWRYPVAIPFLK